MATKLKYPPCVPGLFSERPRRHEFEIVTNKNDEPVLKLDPKSGATLYTVRCKHCGLNDPAKVLH
jgi:uncharacterized protein CbrC (UPF0167 family)